MTVDQVLDGLMTREGGLVDNPADMGGRTMYGISERSNPDLWKPGPPSKEQARARLSLVYVAPFDLLMDMGVADAVRVAVIDAAVLAGVNEAVRQLQRALNIAVDGALGPITAAAASRIDPHSLLVALVRERVKAFVRICQADRQQLIFLLGWVDRAFLFLA